MLSQRWLADDRRWDSLAPILENFRRAVRAGWNTIRQYESDVIAPKFGQATGAVLRYESEVIAPKFGHATRSLRRYVEANTADTVVVSLSFLASIVLGILVGRL